MEFEKFRLKNGLRVVLVPMPEAQTVSAEILVEAGSKYENKKNNGVSHFLEHMVFKGTRKRPNHKMIVEKVEGVGGQYNAFTSKENTGYWVKAPSKHWKLALDIVTDIYQNPLIPAKEMEKERGVILQEEAMYQDMPIRYVWDVFEKLLYGDQPAGWNIVGTTETIKSISRKDIFDYYKNHYLPQSTVLAVAGGFDVDEMKKEIENIFSSIKNGGKKRNKKRVAESQDKPALEIHHKETDQTHLLMGFRACDMFSEDRHACVLAGTILGGNSSSRLFDLLREKHGLTYYIDSASDQMTDSGYLFARAGVEHKNLEKVINLILSEMAKLKSKKVTKKELKNAKEYLKGKTMMSLESSSAASSFFGDQELFKKKIKTPEELFAEIDNVTENDIMKVARKYFINKSLNLAVIGPHKDEDRIKKLLKI